MLAQTELREPLAAAQHLRAGGSDGSDDAIGNRCADDGCGGAGERAGTGAGERRRRALVRDQGRRDARLLGLQQQRPGDAPGRDVQRGRRGWAAHLRDPDRRHRRLLGQERRRRVDAAVRDVQLRERRRRSQLRVADGRHPRLLGAQHAVASVQRRAGRDLPRGQRRQHSRHHLELRRGHERRHHVLGLQLVRPREPAARHLHRRRCRRYPRLRADHGRGPSPAGAASAPTARRSRHRRPGSSPPSARATTTRAGSARTRRSPAWATTPPGEPRRRPGPSAP